MWVEGRAGGVFRKCSPTPKSILILLLTQVGLDDPGVPADFRRESLGDYLAVVQDHHPVADTHDQGHIVFNDQQGYPQVPQLFQEGHEVFGLPGVEARGRFVHEQ